MKCVKKWKDKKSLYTHKLYVLECNGKDNYWSNKLLKFGLSIWGRIVIQVVKRS